MRPNDIISNYKLIEFFEKEDSWKCECTTCGHINNFKTTSFNSIIKKKSKNCRKCAKRVKRTDFKKGDKIGNITLIEYHSAYTQHNQKGNAVWDVKCECGNKFQLRTTDIKSRKEHRCMKCARIDMGLKNRKADAVYKLILASYKKNAKNRNLCFSLTLDDIKKLVHKNCFYCNIPPSNVNYRYNLKYSGIDRLDNEIGYKNGNVVPCCHSCNYSKMNTTLEDFLKRVEQIYNNFKECSETIPLWEYILSKMEKEGILNKDNDIVRSM